MRPRHLVLYGHFGTGNLGNDSSLAAVVHGIRKYQPDAAITCVCSGPDVIAERLAIETLPIDVMERQGGPLNAQRGGRAQRIARRILDEVDFWTKRTRWFRAIDQFIVVGTGAVDDMAVRRFWSQPYDLLKWCRAAKSAGSRVVFLSVGVGPIQHCISRALMLSALRIADYRSCRDKPSLEYLHDVKFDTTGDKLYPDLVFSLPLTLHAPPQPVCGPPRTVGLGVIGYYGWRHNTTTGEPIYLSYVQRLKGFVRWLLEAGYSVRLLAGDLPTDQRPVDDLLDFVRQEGRDDWLLRMTAEPIMDIQSLLEQIAKTDLVVATRFHNVLCSLMLARPVISLGYHAKNDALMAEMRLQAYCQHIERFGVSELIKQFQSLASRAPEVSSSIEQTNAEYRRLLDEQYQAVLQADIREPEGRRFDRGTARRHHA